MELTEKEFQEIAQQLEIIQAMYQRLLDMEDLQQELFLLQYFTAITKKQEQLLPVNQACEKIVNERKDGVNYYETTLIDEVIDLLDPLYKEILPKTWFEKDLLLYKLGYALLEDEFKVFEKFTLERKFQLIIDDLKRRLYNSFVNNPNFKGDNPYYKRHPREFEYSKKLTRELLDTEFNNYIHYFKGD